MLDKAVFGKFAFIKHDKSYQPWEDGGIGQVHLLSRARASWGALAINLIQEPDTWKDIWWEELQKTYGVLADKDLIKGTCGFKKFLENKTSTEVQKQALRTIGELPATMRRRTVLVKKKDKKDINTEGTSSNSRKKEEREEAPWCASQVFEEKIFFNTEYIGNTPLAGRSSKEVEEEAIKWGEEGMVRVKHILRHNKISVISRQQFKRKYPQLQVQYFDYFMKEIPSEWQDALKSGANKCEPSKEEKMRELYMVGIKATMRETEAEVQVEKMKAKDIYKRLIANRWKEPEAMRVGGEIHKIWIKKGRPVHTYRKDISKVLGDLKHPAIPAHMADRCLKQGIGREFGGDKYYTKKKKALNPELGKCKRCNKILDNAHQYRECEEVRKAWILVLKAWKTHTGESLSADDPWVTAWGARWANWTTQEEVDKFGGNSTAERFRVLHAAMIEAIYTEAYKAAPGNAKRIYNKAQSIFHNLVKDRRSSLSVERFEQIWEKSDAVTLRGSRSFQVNLWSKHAPEKVKNATQTGKEGEQVLEIYTDGSCDDKTAGWGFVVIKDSQELFAKCGKVIVGSDKHDTHRPGRATNNTGELEAIHQSILWVQKECPSKVWIRYDSKYAAYMSQGLWNPKFYKEYIRHIGQLVRKVEEKTTVHWKHVKGHSGDTGNDRADKLADL